MKTNSRIFIGNVWHSRVEPVKHSFTYPVFYFAIEISELATLPKKIPFLSYNGFNILSIADKDYLGRKDTRSIAEKFTYYMEDKPYFGKIKKTYLITTPKLFGYTFNPVNFYYCFDQDNQIIAVVKETNNTYGEKHLYVLDDPLENSDGKNTFYTTKKELFVSPFNDMRGKYEVKLNNFLNQPDHNIVIALVRKDVSIFSAGLQGKASELTRANLLKTLIAFPFCALLPYMRIVYQASRLRFGKKLKPLMKAPSLHPMTIETDRPTIDGFMHRLYTSKAMKQFNILMFKLKKRKVRKTKL